MVHLAAGRPLSRFAFSDGILRQNDTPWKGFEMVARFLEASYQNRRGWRRGRSRPKYSYARGVATRPRGVRSIMPICIR